jgi:hypothetical protein
MVLSRFWNSLRKVDANSSDIANITVKVTLRITKKERTDIRKGSHSWAIARKKVSKCMFREISIKKGEIFTSSFSYSF